MLRTNLNSMHEAIQDLSVTGNISRNIVKKACCHMDFVRKVLRLVKKFNGKTEANPMLWAVVTVVKAVSICKLSEMIRNNGVKANLNIADSLNVSKTSASRLVAAASLKNLKSLD